jgi:hypothetical protein
MTLPPLDVCNRQDQLTLIQLRNHIKIISITAPQGIVPGATITLHGTGFVNHLPSTQVPIKIRFVSFGPSGRPGGRQIRRIDDTFSFTIPSDNIILVDVPATVQQVGVVAIMAGDKQCIIVSGGRFVSRDGAIKLASRRIGRPINTTPPRNGTIIITPTPNFGNPFCTASPAVRSIGAFFDQDQNGIVEGFPQADPGIFFPAELVVNINARQGYDIVPGSRFPQITSTRANLVIVAQCFSCMHGLPQFVAVHFAVFGSPGNVTVEPVLMLAGDEFNDPPAGVEANKGIILLGNFDGDLDRTLLVNNLIAKGSATGNVTQGTLQVPYGARINFDFQVPVENR